MMIFNVFMIFISMTDKECFERDVMPFFQVVDERYFIMKNFTHYFTPLWASDLSESGSYENRTSFFENNNLFNKRWVLL